MTKAAMNKFLMFWKKPEDTPPPDMDKLIARIEARNRIYSVTTDIFLVLVGVFATLLLTYN
ncbi:MAG: hypothetical protein HAW61_03965, partial [Candidatus Portiera sp.]|nr:hypothetical protein [Portiera sp.]